MKKYLIFASLLLFLVSCHKVEKEAPMELIDSDEFEFFNLFLENFSEIEEFQLSRVQFPFNDCDFNSISETDCVKIEKQEWEYLKLLPKLNGPISIINVYDNFDLKMRNTGERVLAFEATETHVCAYYYFKLIDEKWFLVERRTCTD